jgi:NAD-specific glutamate dehydrogenase
LSTKEEQSLEKDLILEQVNRLIERLSTKVNAGKDDTLALAKKVNDFQNKIKDITRKMMATLSELTIYQSDALKLQQEKNMKDVELQKCYTRMEHVR